MPCMAGRAKVGSTRQVCVQLCWDAVAEGPDGFRIVLAIYVGNVPHRAANCWRLL